MKWKAELFIFSRDYDFVEKEPDAFVESESKLEACNMIMQYVLTMINKDEDFRINVSKIKGDK
jgi:hypothetical protein